MTNTITISKSLAKHYSLITKDQKHFLSSYQEVQGTYARTLQLTSFSQNNIERAAQRPWVLALSYGITLQKTLHDIAPIDIRVYLNGIEIKNDADKIPLLTDMVIVQQRQEASIHLIPLLTVQSLKNIQEEDELKLSLTSLLNNKLSGINLLSLKECKAIKSSLTSIQ